MANLRAAIEYAGTVLVSIGTGLPAGDLVNLSRALFGQNGRASLQSLARSVERSLSHEIETEHGGVAAAAPVIATLVELLKHHSCDLRTVIEQHGMQEGSVAAAILEDGERLLVGLDADMRALLLKLLTGVYRHFLEQKELLHKLSLTALRTLFEHQALNIAEFERIRSAIERLKVMKAPPVPFTIPAPVGDFQGYEAERATIRAALAGGNAVAISAVQGMGGAGKSELARKVAEEMAAEFPDGQILVDMKGTTTHPLAAADAMTEVLLALGAEEKDVQLDRRKANYRSWLRGKRILILLDNVASGEGLDDLRPPPPTALLVTSRNRLHIANVQPVELERLSRNAAKALLAAIVPTLDDSVSNEIAELCCDLPLALRVAGAYLHETGTSPAAYLGDLKRRRLEHLANSAGDVMRPELDPRYVLGLSYDRLAEDHPAAARSFALLSIFPADFDNAGAAAVLDLGPDKTRRHLGQLIRRSLVQRHGDDRYRLHDLLRELAELQSQESERRNTGERYVKFYHSLLAGRLKSLFQAFDLNGFQALSSPDIPNYLYSLFFMEHNSAFIWHLNNLALTAQWLFHLDLAEHCYLTAIQVISSSAGGDFPLKAAAGALLSHYAIFLNSHNKSREAVGAIRQAIMHYDRIPDNLPDKLSPVARCYGIYADCLESAGYLSESREAQAKSLLLAWTVYKHGRAEMSHWLSLWSNLYRARCVRHGVEADGALLAPIEAELARLVPAPSDAAARS